MKNKIIIPLLVVGLACTSCVYQEGKSYKLEDYRTTMQFRDDFRLMQITDLHLGVQNDLQRDLNFVGKLIDEANPDLIVVTGDSFMYGSKGMVKNLFKFLNEKCKEHTASHPDRLTKFAVTFGNHDNQGDYPYYYIANEILKYATEDGKEIQDHKYAAFIDYKDDNLTGYANYYIDLVDDRNKSTSEVDVKYRLHVFDSNSYHYVGPKYKYEVIQREQLDHIRDIYDYATVDKDYIGMAFFHIPFYQYEELKKEFIEGTNPEDFGQGEFKEGIGDPYYDNGSFRSMRDSNIIAYSVGHEHINYCDIIYNHDSNDIDDKAILSYGVKSTDGIYHDDDMLGYKLIILKDNMTVESFLNINYIKENFINVIDRGFYYED